MLAYVLALLLAQTPQPAAPASPVAGTPGIPTADAGLDLQVRLDRAGFSPGEIDGKPGPVTRKALRAFQRSRQLPPTGQPDARTLAALADAAPGDTLVEYRTTADDVAGPFVAELPEDMMERAKLKALGYTSAIEALGERVHARPALLRALNPSATFTAAGETLRVPNVRPPAAAPAKDATPAAVTVAVSKRGRDLTVRGEGGRVLFYAPVTVGSEHDPLPIGDWKVTGVHRDPAFHYNPDLFWDADPSHAKAKLAPGPNNPVGSVWIDLSRPHYGLHGTPEPANIGRTESHGCVRLTNWDALQVAALVTTGTPVHFRP
jgi:lipoprotein-anchoring transpeptidase ErfK/SrfK